MTPPPRLRSPIPYRPRTHATVNTSRVPSLPAAVGPETSGGGEHQPQEGR